MIDEKDCVKLIKNYRFICENKNITPLAMDINELDWKKIKGQGKLIITIDFNKIQYNEYKKIIRKLLKLRKKINKSKIDIGFKENKNQIIGYLINYNIDDKKQEDFINAISALLLNDDRDMYSYIYDTVCNYLDKQFMEKNLCDFKNNKCGEKINTNSVTGCCHHYKNMFLGPIKLKNNFVLCEYLKNNKCTAECIACKLFTCDYLEKKGVKFRIKDIFLLDTFFNLIQNYIIKFKVFTPKEKIINELLMVK